MIPGGTLMRLELLINVPLIKPLPSLANVRWHWAKRAAHTRAERERVALHVAAYGRGVASSMARALSGTPSTRVTCVLTRISPKRLDDDNLSGAFKAIRDEVAKQVGLDDGSPRWTWKYAQESGAPGYRIHLEVTAGLLTQSEVSR